MVSDADRGGEAPCWAHLIDEPDRQTPPPMVLTSNTIVYCEHWAEAVAFYRNGLGLHATMERDWFVEFELHPGTHLSVADASRATIEAGTGAGLTLSLGVADIEAERTRLAANGIDTAAPRIRWDAHYFFVVDPAGNRIEFWAPLPAAT